jgi:hypothetical protein
VCGRKVAFQEGWAMVEPTRRTVVFGLLAAHWVAELLPLQERASLVVRLIVLAVHTLWLLWELRHWVKQQRSTGNSAQE